VLVELDFERKGDFATVLKHSTKHQSNTRTAHVTARPFVLSQVPLCMGQVDEGKPHK